jgi:hypothetical protein
VAGVIVVNAGYSAAFLTLAAIAALGSAVYLFAMPETKPRFVGASTPETPSTSAAFGVPVA